MASTVDIPTMETEAIRGDAIVLRLPSKNEVYSNEEFWELCKLNPELRLEKNSDGSVVVMTPTGGESGRKSGEVFGQLFIWARENGAGVAFDSSTGFALTSTSAKSPDASWVLSNRWKALSEEERDGLVPIAPDFVAEVKSKSDSLRELRAKMLEYIERGVRLGWLIDPKTRSVEIYRPGKEVERIENATTVSGDPELPGFVLDLGRVW